MTFDRKTAVGVLGVGALVVACGFLAVRAGHSTAGPVGAFNGTGQISALTGVDFQITLLNSTGDSTTVEVTLRVDGREDLGPVDLTPLFLTSGTTRNFVSYGRPDPTDRRTTTYGFTGLLGTGPWRVEGESVSAGIGRDFNPSKQFRARKAWSITLPPLDTSNDQHMFPDSAARVPLGPAFAILDEVVVTSTRVVIRGHFEGIDGRLIPGAHPVPGPATFSIKLQAQENPSTWEFDATLRAQLAALDGTRAEWQVTLP